jgi:hypothetical protein
MCSLGEMQPTKSHHHHHHHLVTSCEAWLPTSHSATSTSVARESTNFSCSRRARVNAVDGGYAWAVAFVRRPRLRTPDRLTGTGPQLCSRGLNHSEPCDGLTIGTLTSADTPILGRIHTLVRSSSISPYCISGPSMELRTASLGK